MDEFLHANLNLWNEYTDIHVRSAYDVEGFKASKTDLHSIELEELGDVAGKTMLHLQCYFGMDSMRWARRGATVTGVDFSDRAIAAARQLNDELGLNCTFVHSNVLELTEHLEGQFDIVFTSYGVLPWLPDLKRWAQVIAHFLKPGGIFYIVELHPFALVFDDQSSEPELKVVYSYFHRPEPFEFSVIGSYADRTAHVEQPVSYEWAHSMGDIVNALLEAGLNIQFLHEFPYCVYKMLPFMEERDGWWRLPKEMPELPLMFSLKATKPKQAEFQERHR